VAVAFDSVGPSSAGATVASNTVLTFSHTVVGANVVLLAGIAVDASSDSGMSCTCKYGGAAMTPVGSIVHSGGITAGFLAVFAIETPAQTANVVATVAGGTPAHISGGSIGISGAAAPIAVALGTPATANTPTNTATSTATLGSNTSGNLLVGFTCSGTSIASATAPSTSRFIMSQAGTGAAGSVAGATSPATGSAVTMAWTMGTDDFAELIVEVLPFGGGGGPIRLPQQVSRSLMKRRKSSQRPQFNIQSPDVTILPPAVTASVSVPVPALPTQISYITGVSGTGPGWFTDNNGQPKLWVAASTWGLPTNAGRWSGSGGGTYQQDFDNFFSQRAAQGVTVLMTDALGDLVDGGAFDNGNTWDNVPPFTTGHDPSSGLNNTFWTRIDYMMNSAKANGITIGFVFNLVYDAPSSGNSMNGWTSTQDQAYGTALGNRYKNQPNIIWLFGNDENPTTNDTRYTSFKTGLTGAGDTHIYGVWWLAEFTSRYATDTNTAAALGASISAFNFCYTYNASYWVIEYAYGEVTNQGAANLLPTTWGDGYFYQGTSGAGYAGTFDRAQRQETWWSLAAGARGFVNEAENTWKWDSGAAPAAVTGNWFSANNLPAIVTYFTALPQWWNLLPDLSSALVTAGRGTRVTGFPAGGSSHYENATTNSWVAASKTPDGTLAVCYLPNATTITVNTALLATGWTATWVDPVTCATSSAGAGPTFNSTAKGNNSRAAPDWVLVFQAAAPPDRAPRRARLALPLPSAADNTGFSTFT
jgi:hypothetical protein